MTILFLLPGRRPMFPPLEQIQPGPGGLVGLGGDFRPATLIEAYQKGIFPWEGRQPIPWFSPDPRMILEPLAFKRSRSLKKLERRGILEVRLDTCFAEVMGNCAKVPREGQRGSWISKKMIRAYGRLHERGIAHSVEVFEDDVLVGGLYGLAMGGVFFGESMFHRRRDASKIALSHLCRLLEAWDFDMVDCQQETAHLASLGAAPIRRTAFNARLQRSLVGGDRWGRRR